MNKNQWAHFTLITLLLMISKQIRNGSPEQPNFSENFRDWYRELMPKLLGTNLNVEDFKKSEKAGNAVIPRAPLYITVGCSGRRVPSVLLDNGSALNVCPLATAIALGFAPSDFGPSTQTVRAYDSTKREVMGTLMIDLQIGPATFSTLFQVLRIPTSFNLLLGRPWIHVAGAIPSSLHQKVKFIHDGQTLEIEDFHRDFVAMSFDQHSSTVVLDMMRGMTFLPGMGLGRRQQGPSEFIAAIDHDTTFGLGFIPTEADYRHMARLRKERVRARLSHTPFDYPIRPYRMSLTDYFVRGSETRPRLEEIDSVVHTDRETELQHLFHQLQFSDGAPDTSFPVAINPTSPDRASMLSLCFPEEIVSDGVIVDPTEVIDGVVPHDEYRDEMDMMTVSQIASIVQLQPVSTFDMFGVSTIEVFEGTQTLPVPGLPEDDSSLFEGIVSPVEGASDLVDPPLSFDVSSGFVSRSDDVSVASFMDLSIFDSDRDSFDHDSGPIDERVSPAAGDVETVDFGTEDQPRELKIGSPLSTDERDRLIHLLRSYLDVFAWSYEDMPGLDPSIVQHHLPTLPHARPVKQKLRRLHLRWSLQVKEEIQKQLSVGFISVVEYPEWLANVVPVPKKDDKVRVCVDFRDLNKASPKDDFPFHTLIYFDGSRGYGEDSFITEWGTYCYRVMPFGLKNAGATYQRAATTLFHDMMHRDVEVYVDDMIVKSECTFGVTSGKLLGHMVSERGIEVDPDKIKAILDMPAPKTEKDIRGFLGRLQYISRFIAILTDILPPTPGHPLLLYLSVSDMALGCMLAQIDDLGKERAIYYLKFDIQYISQKSIKGSIVADHLASLPTSEDRPVDDDFPDEEFVAMTSLSGWCMYFDGAANQSGYGIGVLLVSLRVIIFRETALELDIRQMEVFGDSNLVLRQIQGIGRLGTSAPAYCCLIGEIEDQDDLPWYHDIYQFLRSGTYPEVATTKDRRALRHLATRFVICGDTLYRRSADGMLLLCLDRASADRVMREVHSGVCGPHMGGHMLARKIMRTGYFWLTMETDCCQFVQKCPECQIHGDLIHAPPSELHALTSPWPFSVWGIDIIGKVSQNLPVVTNHTSFAAMGFLMSLISDRGAHFRAEAQTNGAVEAANKNIKRILRKMVETSREWSEKLPFALWAYRTSFRTSTGATPYSLVYGMEAVLPVETEMGSLRVALEQQISETEWAQARFDQLNLLDERRLRAADHVQAYQRRMARAFKKRVKPRHCKRGLSFEDSQRFDWRP
ncbi:Retrovirus-related Pol polyprotein from transposon 297 [Vitis vinifera]|uniref:Retrovirus-related Pol polyprotein from transposon 297 n=1 Tax=Vitis vinifera TaxID=29760 RepID=A0A438GUH6_VITVI|nr:Retrovirus-related Pol polyprotein from transposon 297 [Vitis vinifera]